MTTAACLVLLSTAWLGAPSLSGSVVDMQDRPVAGARVFLEPGLLGALREGAVGADGRFSFDDVLPGAVGVFAVAPGFGFAGRHFNLATSDMPPDFQLTLRPEAQVSGRILNEKNDPVAGARITRVALLDTDKVSIPLSKLRAFGIDEPGSDADGRFTIPLLPEGGLIAIKVGHADFAQEAVDQVSVGDTNLKIKLTGGILIEGTVNSRPKDQAIPDAEVLIQNNEPPHDSIATKTDGHGRFIARLKPGIYLCKASGGGWRSPGWTRLDVTGQMPSQAVALPVAGTGAVRGQLKDAVSEKPIPGARILLESAGHPADLARTDASGEFRLEAAEGSYVVRLEAAPGYAPPGVTTIAVNVAAGSEATLPAFWLAPLPGFDVEILGPDLESAPGAIVTVLRPYQFGWLVADAAGRVRINVTVLPEDGRILGLAEHPDQAIGAVFALTRSQTEVARVQLLPFARATGKVVSLDNQGMAGAVVSGFVPGENPDQEMLLWRTVSRKGGLFEWNAVVPGLPQRCLVRAGITGKGESSTFTTGPSEARDLGAITVDATPNRESWFSKNWPWYENSLIAGTKPDTKTRAQRSAIVLCCSPAEAPMVVAGVAQMASVLGPERFYYAVLVNGNCVIEAPGNILMLRGAAPGTATTYVLDSSDNVILETFGLPPVFALHGR